MSSGPKIELPSFETDAGAVFSMRRKKQLRANFRYGGIGERGKKGFRMGNTGANVLLDKELGDRSVDFEVESQLRRWPGLVLAFPFTSATARKDLLPSGKHDRVCFSRPTD